jgi:hypothetical protein
MPQKKLAWVILPGAPETFFDLWKETESDGQFVALLVHAQKCGWIEILGQTDKDPKDIVAVLQEFYDVKYLKLGDKDGD